MIHVVLVIWGTLSHVPFSLFLLLHSSSYCINLLAYTSYSKHLPEANSYIRKAQPAPLSTWGKEPALGSHVFFTENQSSLVPKLASSHNLDGPMEVRSAWSIWLHGEVCSWGVIYLQVLKQRGWGTLLFLTWWAKQSCKHGQNEHIPHKECSSPAASRQRLPGGGKGRLWGLGCAAAMAGATQCLTSGDEVLLLLPGAPSHHAKWAPPMLSLWKVQGTAGGRLRCHRSWNVNTVYTKLPVLSTTQDNMKLYKIFAMIAKKVDAANTPEHILWNWLLLIL